MPFWDRFALWVYLGLADVQPVGRDAAARLFGQAYASGQLDFGAANDLTVLLAAGVCCPGGPVRLAAEAEFHRRRLGTEYDRVRLMQRTLTEPRLTEILELNRPHRAATAQLLTGALTAAPGHEVWINLADFLSRVLVADPPAARARATAVLLSALQRYYRFPVGTVDFVSLLYRHACGHLGVGAALPVYGTEPQMLAAVPDPTERTFLVRCGTHLSDADRVLLFMHFYGRLTAGQIAGALCFAGSTWTADEVAAEVERCWVAVL